MIPKVIHYCWFGKKKLPNSVKKNINSWKKFCPDFEIREWNESNFDINSNSFVAQAYKNKAWAFVSDYARLDIIYRYGGIYLDTDVEIVKNINELLVNHAFVGLQRRDLLCNTGLGFGAEPNNPIIGKMREVYLNLNYTSSNLNAISCPQLNTSIIQKMGDIKTDIPTKMRLITIYPPTFFDPFSPGYIDDLMSSSTYTIHHYDSSWLGYKKRFQRKIVDLVGQRKINELKRYFLKFY